MTLILGFQRNSERLNSMGSETIVTTVESCILGRPGKLQSTPFEMPLNNRGGRRRFLGPVGVFLPLNNINLEQEYSSRVCSSATGSRHNDKHVRYSPTRLDKIIAYARTAMPMQQEFAAHQQSGRCQTHHILPNSCYRIAARASSCVIAVAIWNTQSDVALKYISSLVTSARAAPTMPQHTKTIAKQ